MPKTRNFYLQAAKHFCAWLVKSKRTNENPLAGMELANVATDRRHDCRELSLRGYQQPGYTCDRVR